ncbi:hypothetical protein [Pseudoroseomonas cervicalis]|uniref:hypothetical protein n=1 Tax=Teichococcus cervicalis TaxID=204525 RepID=UPI0027806BE2|nr:hypothetical protein [Pseudoroseomonas cervicalis]MDQ1077762.1 hypothetical protein [Pseudoroseomonas cervicalis]
MRSRLPWELHPSLTEDRLVAAARLLVRGREQALRMADYEAGDDPWSVGCRAYSFSRHQLRAAAEAGRYPWLGVLDHTHHFVFLIDGIPVRFYRGDAEDPNRRTLRQQEDEAAQMAMAFGGETESSQGLMFRFALEPAERGGIERVVFLALRGEEGRAECFWPVPLPPPATAVPSTPRPRPMPAQPPAPMQLALLPGVAAGPPTPRRPRRSAA